MYVDPANATELSTIAREVGAQVLAGDLRYPSEIGSWQLGDVDLGEYLDHYREQPLTVILVRSVRQGREPSCVASVGL